MAKRRSQICLIRGEKIKKRGGGGEGEGGGTKTKKLSKKLFRDGALRRD